MIVRTYDAGIITGSRTEWEQNAYPLPNHALAAALEWAAARTRDSLSPDAVVVSETTTDDDYDTIIAVHHAYIRIPLIRA